MKVVSMYNGKGIAVVSDNESHYTHRHVRAEVDSFDGEILIQPYVGTTSDGFKVSASTEFLTELATNFLNGRMYESGSSMMIGDNVAQTQEYSVVRIYDASSSTLVNRDELMAITKFAEDVSNAI